MTRTSKLMIVLLLLVWSSSACQAQEVPPVSYDATQLKFSGERAFAIETEFVTHFPNRHSGQPNNRRAAEWLLGQFTELGWDCSIDNWEIVNYSRLTPLNNVVCHLAGESEREILVVAHLDQASTTVQGADNDGSGIAILLHLAEIFATENNRPYTLTFVATDAEEYGMIGSARFIDTHPNTKNIIAGMSLDNLGRDYYEGMNMELIGQYDGYGPIWLALTAREAAKAAGLDVYLRAPIDQITDQAAPISFMDQGPMVAAGVPALGFASHVPAEYSDLHYHLWHDPDDTLEHQSAESVKQSGLVVEALIRQLLSMKDFPQETGPYLYLDNSGTVVHGAPLWVIFIVFTGLFFAGSIRAGKFGSWKNALPHFLGLWLPLLASVLSLYGFVAVGLMNKYYAYPATTKDPDLLNPRWLTIILFVTGLSLFFCLGRYLVRRYAGTSAKPHLAEIKSLALFVVALGALFLLFRNPFSLLFFVPLLFWFLIKGRNGIGRVLDILFFLLGGLVIYALIYMFGFITLRYNLAFLWYLLYMFSTRMIGFPIAAMITAVLAAGLSMVVIPPLEKV